MKRFLSCNAGPAMRIDECKSDPWHKEPDNVLFLYKHRHVTTQVGEKKQNKTAQRF